MKESLMEVFDIEEHSKEYAKLKKKE